MTLGDLYDRLRAIEQAEFDIENARRSISYGGSPETMKGKHEETADTLRLVASAIEERKD